MTLIELLRGYLDGKTPAIEVIRRVSGIFNPESAVDLLTLVNAITRVEQGDLDKETFAKVWKLSDTNQSKEKK